MRQHDVHMAFLRAAKGLHIVIDPPDRYSGPQAYFAGRRDIHLADVLGLGSPQEASRRFPSITTAEVWDAVVFAGRVLAALEDEYMTEEPGPETSRRRKAASA